ncbi:DUF3099 domain-containing protein [Asanoa sp. WMMD1127]|uniref:DUF3099 domain-containing protein n=1 Tax=Asanoa sp. WMMD1127 TaxID=3016107 RepID=UPI002417CFD0|nr:DUF3099 domain-containing protein [Asanoa sp. WMMD1127]MDG4823775.1 DUF3099 domain-containing protein [Asanoa sp. WMMD1127]
MKRPAARPVVITDAARSQDDQLRSRTHRYVFMMLTRAVCVIVFAVLVGTRPPLLWLWLLLVGAAAVVLPWLAVILANDRPPKEKYRHFSKGSSSHKEKPAQPSLPTQPARDDDSAPHKTIDAEP